MTKNCMNTCSFCDFGMRFRTLSPAIRKSRNALQSNADTRSTIDCSLPNLGDETGAMVNLKITGPPILVQDHPDTFGKTALTLYHAPELDILFLSPRIRDAHAKHPMRYSTRSTCLHQRELVHLEWFSLDGRRQL